MIFSTIHKKVLFGIKNGHCSRIVNLTGVTVTDRACITFNDGKSIPICLISLLTNRQQSQTIYLTAHVNCQLSKMPRTQIKIVQPLSVLENGAAVINVGDL